MVAVLDRSLENGWANRYNKFAGRERERERERNRQTDRQRDKKWGGGGGGGKGGGGGHIMRQRNTWIVTERVLLSDACDMTRTRG